MLSSAFRTNVNWENEYLRHNNDNCMMESIKKYENMKIETFLRRIIKGLNQF